MLLKKKQKELTHVLSVWQVTGVQLCFKNINRCDQHPVCDPGPNTGKIAWDEYGCLEKYKEKGLTPKDATIECQSVYHNEETAAANLSLGIVMIEAVPCDKIPTCWKKGNETLSPDENLCDNELLTLWVPGKRIRFHNKNLSN